MRRLSVVGSQWWARGASDPIRSGTSRPSGPKRVLASYQRRSKISDRDIGSRTGSRAARRGGPQQAAPSPRARETTTPHGKPESASRDALRGPRSLVLPAFRVGAYSRAPRVPRGRSRARLSRQGTTRVLTQAAAVVADRRRRPPHPALPGAPFNYPRSRPIHSSPGRCDGPSHSADAPQGSRTEAARRWRGGRPEAPWSRWVVIEALADGVR